MHFATTSMGRVKNFNTALMEVNVIINEANKYESHGGLK